MKSGAVQKSVLRLVCAALALVLPFACVTASEYVRVQTTEVDSRDLEPGQLMRVRWERFYVWIIKRSEEDQKVLAEMDFARLAAPEGENWESSFVRAYDTKAILPRLLYLDQVRLEKSAFRSIRADVLVVMGLSPQTGCTLEYLPANVAEPPIRNWPGGFHDPCSGTSYDMAGRMFDTGKVKNAWNLYIPPHQYDGDNKIVIGLGKPPRELPSRDFSPVIDYDALDVSYRLYEAAKRGRIDIVEGMLASGCEVDTPVANGVTPLLVAVTKGQYPVAHLLLKQGADPRKGNHQGFAPVHGAVAGYEEKMIRLLAGYGADMNQICQAADCKGPPLNFAISWMRDDSTVGSMVQELIAAGADPELDYDGMDAYAWAKETGQDYLIPLMKSAVASR